MESWGKRQSRYWKQNSKNAVKMHPGNGYTWKFLLLVIVVVILVLALPHLW